MSTDKQALDKWEEFRKSIIQSTPASQDETYQQRSIRMKRLEDDREAWKRYYFPKYFKYPSPAFHASASRRIVENFKAQRHLYIVRSWARGLSKTTTLMMDILYLVLTGKLKSIILSSSTYDAAERFLTRYMCELDSNQRIIHDYGKQERAGSWRMGNFTTLLGAKFLALGAGQSPRGESNEEVRSDCLIMEDFDTDEECRNADIIQKKWEWFEKALFFTVDTASAYLVVWNGNIIAEDCCVSRAGAVADHHEIINIRDEYGMSVWPEKNTEEDIDYQLSKVSYESSQQEMFNNPMRVGKAFREMRYGKCPPLSHVPFLVIYADPATSNNDKPTAKSRLQNSCKSVVVLGHKGMFRYVYKVFVDNVGNSAFIDWLFTCNEFAKEARARFIFIENNSLQDPFFQQVLKPLIIQKSKAAGVMLPVLTDERKKADKYVRIEANLEPLNRNGYLILNIDEQNDPHMKRLEAQFKSASPTSKTMDGPDAVEGAVDIVNRKFAAGHTQMEVRAPFNKSVKRF
jgi:hypothetical protein